MRISGAFPHVEGVCETFVESERTPDFFFIIIISSFLGNLVLFLSQFCHFGMILVLVGSIGLFFDSFCAKIGAALDILVQ